MNPLVLDKYAKLAVETGVNVAKGQMLVVNAPVETQDFVRRVVKAAYQAGAGYVLVRWNDDLINKLNYSYALEEKLVDVPSYLIDQHKYFIDQGACVLSIVAPSPGLLADVDGAKVAKVQAALQKAIAFYREHMMGNRSQWSLVSVPTEIWATKVFPELETDQAVAKLWDAILSAVRVSVDNDPVALWDQHNKRLHTINEKLNQFQFKTLHFKNSLGTDLKVGLVKNHRWAGGSETSVNGVVFNPNIPTEESFTMPDKYRVEGTVVATKPLNYQGKLIDGFALTFKDGKVVSYTAKKEEATLKHLLEVDQGSCYLGEVALISHDSPISNTNILFYNTLFDENASCHLALGRAYPMNVEGGLSMSQEQLEKAGMNFSVEHADFMFGSADMSIIGYQEDGSEVVVFKDGNFAF